MKRGESDEVIKEREDREKSRLKSLKRIIKEEGLEKVLLMIIDKRMGYL